MNVWEFSCCMESDVIEQESESESILIGACRKVSPIYTLDVDGNSKVFFEFENNNRTNGQLLYSLYNPGPKMMKIDMFDKIEFSIDDQYFCLADDISTVITILR